MGLWSEFTDWIIGKPKPIVIDPVEEQQALVDLWVKKDAETVDKFCTANINRVLAVNKGDKAEAEKWLNEYNYWFAAHREYRTRELAAIVKLEKMKRVRNEG